MRKRKPKSQQPKDEGAWVSWEDATRPCPPTGEMVQVELSLVLTAQPPHTADKALDALLIAGRAGRPAPAWAVTHVDQILDDRFTGKIDNLDIAFGYSTGTRKKDSPVQNRLKKLAMQKVFLDIWRLTLLDFTVSDACDKAAGRLLTTEKRWNRTAYRLPWDRWSFKPRGTPDRDVCVKLRATLNRDYYKWKKSISPSLQENEAAVRAWLQANREIYLKQFPTD